MRTRLAFSWLLLAALPGLASAQQAWPSKPVRIVVSIASGGVSDLLARALAGPLSRSLGQPVIVDNRPGGDGLIGAMAAGRSTADGYTLYLASQSFIGVDPNTHVSLPVDPQRDFVGIAVIIDTTPIAIGVNPGLAAKSIPELVALAKAQPGKLSYGVTVPILSMVGQWLNRRAGIDMVEINYKTIAQQIAETVSGLIQVTISNVGSLESMARAGKIRIIAVTSPGRVPGWEDVPSIMDTYPDLDVGGGLVLLGPAGLPPAIVERLNRESDAIVRSAEFGERAKSFGWANLQGARSLAGVAEYIRLERERWAKVVKLVGIQPK